MAQNLHELHQAQNQIQRAVDAETLRDAAITFIEGVAHHADPISADLAKEWLEEHGIWTKVTEPTSEEN